MYFYKEKNGCVKSCFKQLNNETLVEITEDEFYKVFNSSLPSEDNTTQLSDTERIAQLEQSLQEQKEINEAQDETIVEIFESLLPQEE